MLFTLNSNAQVLPFGFLGSKNTPTINITVGTYTYSGSAQGPSEATNTGTGTNYTYSYLGTGNTSYGPSVTRPTNIGTYSVTVSLSASGDGNYTTATASAAFTITLAVGDTYGGGKVAYILVAGDPGYDANTPHGLIAATSDQSNGIRWYNGSYTTTGATGTAIGTGLANTNTIITSQKGTTTSYAAGKARAYTGGGYTDWYLPSKDELNKLYLNRSKIGGFKTATYWSSSEYASDNAWYQNLYPKGSQLKILNKSYTFYVRAIRAF